MQLNQKITESQSSLRQHVMLQRHGSAEDFSTVCDIAGVDAEYVRSFAFKVIKSKEIKYVRRRINAVLTFD